MRQVRMVRPMPGAAMVAAILIAPVLVSGGCGGATDAPRTSPTEELMSPTNATTTEGTGNDIYGESG